MAATFSKQYLTGGAANGTPIKVGAIVTPGTLIHTVPASVIDEIWLWAYNSDTLFHEVTVEFGGATAPDFNIKLTIPPKSGPIPLIPGWLLAPTLTVKVFADLTNVCTIGGYVNRDTP